MVKLEPASFWPGCVPGADWAQKVLMLQVKFHGRNMIVVWPNPELNVLLVKALLV